MSKSNFTKFFLLWLVCVSAVFAVHWSFLFQGFWIEDIHFLGIEFNPAQPGMAARINSISDALSFFRTDRAWFYRPFFLIYVGGLQLIWGNSPILFHAASLVLHGSIITLLSALVYRLSRNSLALFFSALLFLLWPEKHQAVWWISSASTLLASLFLLLSVHFWISFRQSDRFVFYVSSFIAATLAVGSKTEGVFVVLVIIALEAAYRRPPLRSALSLAPFVLLAAGYAMLERASFESFTDMGMNWSWSARWQAFLEYDMMAGFSMWSFLLAGCVLAFRSADRRSRALSLGLILAGALSGRLLALALGAGVFPSRFFYMPAIFIAGGVAILLATSSAVTPRYMFGLILALAIAAASQPSTAFATPFLTEGLVVVVTVATTLLLKRFQSECEAIYPLSVPVAFIICAYGQALGWAAVTLAAFTLAHIFNRRVSLNELGDSYRSVFAR